MPYSKAFKQFQKDCPEHTTRKNLLDGIPQIQSTYKPSKKSKTTSNSKIPNRF